MDTMIVMYNLADGQKQEDFEQWLRDVDLPGYKKLRSMRNPSYYRGEGLLGEAAPAPYRYVVVIEMDSPEAVEQEMAAPEWEGFVADIESRIKDAAYVTATRIAP